MSSVPIRPPIIPRMPGRPFSVHEKAAGSISALRYDRRTLKRFLLFALPLLILTMAVYRFALEALGMAPDPAALSHRGVPDFPQWVMLATWMLEAVGLGSRLGEFSSMWDEQFVRPRGFIHVDLDLDAIGVAYPRAETYGIRADIDAFVRAVLAKLPTSIPARSAPRFQGHCPPAQQIPRARGLVRPQVLGRADMGSLSERVKRKLAELA